MRDRNRVSFRVRGLKRQTARLSGCACLLLWLAAAASAQSASPAAQVPLPPAMAPPPLTTTPTIRVNSTVVLVPTLVEEKDGKVIYGLGADSFALTDNGVPQQLHVDDDLDTTPVSLVVCMQKGRSSELEFEKFERLAPLLNLFLGTGNGEVALVEFDSQLEFRGNWTNNTDEVQQDLDQLTPGDGGAALLDAAGYSIGLLEQRPADRRRILLLVSESRDHGSKRVSPKALVEQIGASNTLVLSLTWSPAKAQFLQDFANPGAGGIDLIRMAVLAVNAMKANAAKSLAVMSGGEAMSFTSEHGFEDRVAEMASHARNRYMLSFRPTQLTPGLHRLEVELKGDMPAKVVARTDYWAGAAEEMP
jgi:VWFA-related protein